MKLNKFIIVLTTIAAMSMTYAKASNTPTNEDVFSSNQTYEEYRDSIQNEYVKCCFQYKLMFLCLCQLLRNIFGTMANIAF